MASPLRRDRAIENIFYHRLAVLEREGLREDAFLPVRFQKEVQSTMRAEWDTSAQARRMLQEARRITLLKVATVTTPFAVVIVAASFLPRPGGALALAATQSHALAATTLPHHRS